MKERSISFTSGHLRLEGVLAVPEGSRPFPAVVVCHPHPLYGGSMDNNLVSNLCQALTEASLVSLRFNFRGVGRSHGTYDNGVGEMEDTAAAIAFLRALREVDPARVGLAGYSAGAVFGTPMGCADQSIRALAAVSPPLAMFDFGCLRSCTKPKLLVSGSTDTFTPEGRFLEFCCSLPEPREYEIIEGADHFWLGYETVLATRAVAFFRRALQPSALAGAVIEDRPTRHRSQSP
jgi:uncharacterized protein